MKEEIAAFDGIANAVEELRALLAAKDARIFELEQRLEDAGTALVGAANVIRDMEARLPRRSRSPAPRDSARDASPEAPEETSADGARRADAHVEAELLGAGVPQEAVVALQGGLRIWAHNNRRMVIARGLRFVCAFPILTSYGTMARLRAGVLADMRCTQSQLSMFVVPELSHYGSLVVLWHSGRPFTAPRLAAALVKAAPHAFATHEAGYSCVGVRPPDSCSWEHLIAQRRPWAPRE